MSPHIFVENAVLDKQRTNALCVGTLPHTEHIIVIPAYCLAKIETDVQELLTLELTGQIDTMKKGDKSL